MTDKSTTRNVYPLKSRSFASGGVAKDELNSHETTNGNHKPETSPGFKKLRFGNHVNYYVNSIEASPA